MSFFSFHIYPPTLKAAEPVVCLGTFTFGTASLVIVISTANIMHFYLIRKLF